MMARSSAPPPLKTPSPSTIYGNASGRFTKRRARLKRILLRFTLVFLFLTLIRFCNAVMRTSTVPSDSPATWQQITANDKQTDELQKQIEQIASAAKGRVGVAAEVLETAESISLNPNEHFPMQSVYKLPIGMAVLAQVDSGKLN